MKLRCRLGIHRYRYGETTEGWIWTTVKCKHCEKQKVLTKKQLKKLSDRPRLFKIVYFKSRQ